MPIPDAYLPRILLPPPSNNIQKLTPPHHLRCVSCCPSLGHLSLGLLQELPDRSPCCCPFLMICHVLPLLQTMQRLGTFPVRKPYSVYYPAYPSDLTLCYLCFIVCHSPLTHPAPSTLCSPLAAFSSLACSYLRAFVFAVPSAGTALSSSILTAHLSSRSPCKSHLLCEVFPKHLGLRLRPPLTLPTLPLPCCIFITFQYAVCFPCFFVDCLSPPPRKEAPGGQDFYAFVHCYISSAWRRARTWRCTCSIYGRNDTQFQS